MKNNLGLSFKGFSLVELMVTLIIVSLLVAALAPAITKRLSSKDITVGSFGGGSGGGECPSSVVCKNKYFINSECKCQECSDVNCKVCEKDICSECDEGFMLENGICVSRACAESLDEFGNSGAPSAKCCESVGAKFLSKEQTGTTDLCMMKYNAGDDYFTYQLGGQTKIYHPDYYKLGISMNKVGQYCMSGNLCCWRGQTSSNSKDVYPNYPAKNRTLCGYDAAVKICNNWALGSKKGAWRLMTQGEANSLAAIMRTETADNPIISRYMDAEGLQFCNIRDSSNGANMCAAHGSACQHSGEDACYPSVNWISTTNGYIELDTTNGTKTVQVGTFSCAGASVRCVSANLNKKVSATDDEPTTTNSVEPRNQADCPDGTLFINKKYLGSGATNNICMMKYNLGDDRYRYNGNYYHLDYYKLGISMNNVGQYCMSTNMCCWRGQTSSGFKDIYPNYSAKDRAVCSYDAAEVLCANWAYAGTKPGHWRLITEGEAMGLVDAIKSDGDGLVGEGHSAYFSRFLDSEGLQLCNYTDATRGANLCPAHGDGCQRSGENDACYAHANWIASTKKYIKLYDYKVEIATSSTGGPGSVRCVSDNIREVLPDPEEEEYQTNEPRNQADCDKYKALFIDKKYLNGAPRNICMTKYNFADEDAVTKGKPYLGTNTAEDYANVGITYVSSGERCSDTAGYCCWKGNTSTGYSDVYPNYSAGNRTVCEYNAASILCSNWAPDIVSKGKWRLITEGEATGLIDAIKSDGNGLVSEGHSAYFSRFLDGEGLQLCNYTVTTHGANKCPAHGSACDQSGTKVCYPQENWIGTTNKSIKVYDYKVELNTISNGAAGSVRCVSDTVDTSN